MNISDTVKVALITAVAPTIFSAAAFVTSVRNADKVEKVAVQVEAVHIATNSMKDALVKATRDASLLEGHAEGVKDEKKDAKVRQFDARKK